MPGNVGVRSGQQEAAKVICQDLLNFSSKPLGDRSGLSSQSFWHGVRGRSLRVMNSKSIRPIGYIHELSREGTPFPYRPLHTTAPRLHDDGLPDFSRGSPLLVGSFHPISLLSGA